MLSRDAQEWADEIRSMDWSDAPFRLDRAGHNRSDDKTQSKQLDPRQVEVLQGNIIFVACQVLWHRDKNFDPVEFAKAAGGNPKLLTRGVLESGVRKDWDTGEVDSPGRSS